MSEHLAAAISGDSTLLVQGTAGTGEEAIRYGWNYARLLAEGPSRDALVPEPGDAGDGATAKIARVEELTRIPADVQDALITILSEKTLPIPELGDGGPGAAGLQRDRHRQRPRPRRQRAVAALRRRFNTVVLPLPATADEEVEIVARRVDADGPRARAARPEPPALEEIRRVVTVFRELRAGATEDGRTKAQVADRRRCRRPRRSRSSPAGSRWRRTSATAGCAPGDVAAGLVGAVVRDPVAGRGGLAASTWRR